MKSPKQYIIEKLNVSKPTSDGSLLNRLENALPELEEAIVERLGDPKLRNFDFGLTVTESEDRAGKPRFEITSGNLIELTGPIGKITYDEFKFITWGGNITDTGKEIWFNPKFEFHYINGGSNGTDAFWGSLWFILENDSWKLGRPIS